VVWGSESTGARNPPSTGESWRKSNSEVTWQRQTSSYIDWLFNRNGYVSANNQGSNNTGSGREAILSKIQNLEQNYPRYAVVDFDHGVGISINNIFHYMFEDNTGTRVGTAYDNSVAASGNTVFDYNVYGNTTGKAFFAFINTCMSADYSNAYSAIPSTDTYSSYTQGTLPDGSARGMPYAWTHRYVGSQMSSDGYGSGKDSGNNCYIGFNYGSAALDQTILNSDYHYYYWIYHFFYYALSNDYSIHTALDLASQDAFYYSPNFDGSPLNTGFTAIWPMYIQGQWRDSWQGTNFTMANCHMKIYGNSDLKLYQPLITLVASLGLSPTFTINGQSYSPGNYRLISGTYSVTVNDIPGRRFTSLTYNGVSYTSRPASIPLTQNGALLATYIY
jgi:hypothetical protein